MAQTPLDAIADDRGADTLVHHETDRRDSVTLRAVVWAIRGVDGSTGIARRRKDDMGDECGPSALRATADRGAVVLAAAHAMDLVEQRAQADSLERPLRRRDDRIERPARVRMRSRKPCFLERRRLFGWNVRLLTGLPHVGRWRAALA
jgi:hypothetical protein